MTMHVRDFREADRRALTELWDVCGLTRPWNAPDDEALGFERQEVTVYGKWLKDVPETQVRKVS